MDIDLPINLKYDSEHRRYKSYKYNSTNYNFIKFLSILSKLFCLNIGSYFTIQES